MSVRPLLLLLCGVIAWGTGPLQAQANRTVAGGGLIFEGYRFSDPDATGIEGLSLLTVPFALRAPLGRTVTVDFVGTFARGSLQRSDGSSVALSGLTDTQVSLSAAVVPDRFSIGAIALLPTGKQKHTDAEAEVAGAIGADLLPFRISNWSTGGGIGLSSSVAHSTGTVGLGISASYVVGREFDLLAAEDFAYRPGNQLSVRGVLDASVGDAGKLALQLTFQKASEDRINGSNLYRPGDRFYAMTSYTFRAGVTGSGIVYTGLFHRSSGAYLLESAFDAPGEDLWLAGGGLRIPLRGAVLQPSVDLRVVRRSNGVDQGYLLGAGTSLEWVRAGGVTLIPSVRARFGNVLVREGIESGFTGLDAGLIVRFGSAR